MPKEEVFWEWFSKNQEVYYLNAENPEVQERIFNDLTEQLKKVHEDLVFEFGPLNNSKIREFTISADGIETAFPYVSKLVEKAPKLEKWKFYAFRQPLKDDKITLDFGSFKISYDDIYFQHSKENGKISIQLNIRNFNNDNPQIKNAVYILLDALIGEYNTTKKIGWIDWVKLDENNIENLYPLVSLREIIEE